MTEPLRLARRGENAVPLRRWRCDLFRVRRVAHVKAKKDFPDPDAIKETVKMLAANTGFSRDEFRNIFESVAPAILFFEGFTKEGAPPANPDEHERILIPVEQLPMVLQKAIDAGIVLSKFMSLTVPTLVKAPAQARSSDARRRVAAKLAADPKQAAKSQVKKLWNDWQHCKKLHKGAAAFARFACGQNLGIESEKNVGKWCREWVKETQAEVTK